MSSIRAYCLPAKSLPATIEKPNLPASDSPSSDPSIEVAKSLTRSNFKIEDRNGDGKITVSYAFTEFSEAKKRAFRQSLKSWEDVVKVKFIENGKNADTHLSVREVSGGGGNATMPNSYGAQDVNIGKNEGAGLHASMVHEIGHTLGLEHPDLDLPQSGDVYSTMSYRHTLFRPEENSSNTFVSDSSQTPMMHDIAGAHLLYKANDETRKDNTTYGFNSNTERDHYTLTSPNDLPFFCVWDKGGNDTLDFSGFTNNQRINLNAGELSDIGGRQGNVSIANGVVIENAIGGSGHDVLIGNDASNRITGGPGGDELSGGASPDVFVYHRASDSPPERPDVLKDFTSGVDKIDLSSVLKEANIHTLKLVDHLTGEKGQITLSYDENVKLYKLSLDVSGDADSVLLILSKGPIKPEDILTDADVHTPISPPKPDPEPEPAPTPDPTPKPDPEPEPEPTPDPSPEPTPEKNPDCTHEEDTVFGFNSNTGRASSTLTSHMDKPSFSVHDNIGNDTLDFSGFIQDQLINLTPGSNSSVGGLIDNVHVTQGTLIENAIGGRGNDRIMGNAADNVLTGGPGRDYMAGNGGFNTFNYDAASDSTRSNADLLVDFTTGKDKIDLSKLSENEHVTLNYVQQYRGRAGDTILVHNPITDRYFLGIDLTGNRKTDFLIKSTRPISSEDIIGLNIEDDGYF